MEAPNIVFITSKACGHCIAFRGQDGLPNDDKPWNYKYIRNIVCHYI